MRNTYKIFARKSLRDILLEAHRRKWKDNIKRILKKSGVDWIQVGHDRVKQ